MERERERREKMIACHSCISSGAKTEAEMKNVICQDYSCASIHTHTHTHALHTNPAPGRNRAISPFWVCSHLLEAHHPLPRMICMPRGRGAVPIYCLLLIDPLPFTNSPSKSSRSRVHAPFSVPSLSSITVVRLYQPPLPPPSIKSRPV